MATDTTRDPGQTCLVILKDHVDDFLVKGKLTQYDSGVNYIGPIYRVNLWAVSWKSRSVLYQRNEAFGIKFAHDWNSTPFPVRYYLAR